MPAIAPIRASSREPKRVRPIPRAVRTAVLAMIYGDPAADETNAAPLSFVQAAKIAQIEPYVLRRWLDKPQVIALIRSERAVFRRALCAGNELALANIRDRGENDAARVRSVLALEAIDQAAAIQSRGQHETPGITINIVTRRDDTTAPTTIDARPIELEFRSDSVDSGASRLLPEALSIRGRLEVYWRFSGYCRYAIDRGIAASNCASAAFPARL